jgi:hypothetical protein
MKHSEYQAEDKWRTERDMRVKTIAKRLKAVRNWQVSFECEYKYESDHQTGYFSPKPTDVEVDRYLRSQSLANGLSGELVRLVLAQESK